ncbi:MAG: hypothetical protein WC279_11920 [Sulfurimonas sp.]|uniref:hypothetical protein n=1 Tax=Sulfurimonas sp. TaxID=2022749 RepID=UPI003567B1A2
MVSPVRKYPEKPGEFSSKSITEFNNALQTVMVSKNDLYDLRFARTEDLLGKVRTVLLRPDRGVSIEFNLTDKKIVWDGLLEVYDKYVDIVPSVKYLIQFSSIPISRVVSGMVRPGNTWALEYIETAVSRLSGAGLEVPSDIQDALDLFYETAEEALTAIRHASSLLDYATTVADLAWAFDRKDSTSVTSFRNIAAVKENLRKLSASSDSDKEQQTLDLINNCTTALDIFAGYPLAATAGEEERVSPRLAILRLFPAAAAVVPQLPQIATIRQSYRKYIQTAVPAPNITAQLRNIIAFNTLDTQWVTFYMEVFDIIFRYRNPKFVLRCGTYRIQDCNIAESIVIPDTGSSLESFNMDIISERTGLDLESL